MIKVDPIYSGKFLELDEVLPEWDEDALLCLNSRKDTTSVLPTQDFAQPTFDVKRPGRLKCVFLLVSTPRSGSTALCDYFYRKRGIVAHEYFQPFQYMPALAERWSCVDGQRICPERYVKALITHRTSKSGVLGINTHGSHLNIFELFRRYIDPKTPIVALYLERQDKVAQAVSYYIAANTKKWSSYFDVHSSMPEYSYQGIKAKLTSIINQEKRAELYLSESGVHSQTVSYESMIQDKVSLQDVLKKQLSIKDITLSSSKTRRQSGLINSLFSERFLRDLLANSG